jgi:hypothetical protein
MTVGASVELGSGDREVQQVGRVGRACKSARSVAVRFVWAFCAASAMPLLGTFQSSSAPAVAGR